MKTRAKQKKGGSKPAAQPRPRPSSGVEAGLPRPPKPQPAELDQDAGGGYNPDHTYPQT